MGWQGEVRLFADTADGGRMLDVDAHPSAVVPMQAVNKALREHFARVPTGTTGRAACSGRLFAWAALGSGLFEVSESSRAAA